MARSLSRLQYDRRKYRMDELPDGIAIEPIMGCNLRCPMCPVPTSTTAMDGRTPTVMPLDLYRRIIEQISDRPRSVLLTIMGEPLLHPRILDFVRLAKAAQHHVGLITNGTKLTRDVSTALLDAGLNYLAMSIDGFNKDTYESIRIGARHSAVMQEPYGIADLEIFRPDVGEVFPGDGHSFSGFTYVLDTRRIPNGMHTIDVLVTDTAAHAAVLGTRSVKVMN